jgi:hypothetical protein
MVDKVYDLDTGDFAAPDNSEMSSDMETLMNAFNMRVVNASATKERLQNDYLPVDLHKPVVTLVATGQSKNPLLENAIIFLAKEYEGNEPAVGVHAHLALDPNTPIEKIKALNGNFFSQGEGKPYCGYLNIPRRGDDLEMGDFESAAMDLSDMGLKTVPIPFNSYGLGMMPMFFDEGTRLNQMRREDVAKTLGMYLQDQCSVVNMPDDLVPVAQNMIAGFSVNNTPDPSSERDNRFEHAPRMGLR